MHRNAVPSVVSGGKVAVVLTPDNMIGVTEIAFFESGAAKKTITEADAVAKVADMLNEVKSEDAIAALLKGKTFSVVGSAADAVA